MFIGRRKELETLRRFYEEDGLSLMVIYGRRRIGKSSLIAEFVKDEKAIYYMATKVGKERNLALFSQTVVDFFMPGMEGATFQSLEATFDYIGKNADGKLVLVIDELPYWAKADESLLSALQKYIDSLWANREIKIILCGSSLSFMEEKVLSEKSPIFGRRDCQMKLDAFSYLEAAEFVPGYSPEDKAIVYGVTGGVGKYLSLIDPEKSIDENIIDQFFSPSGYLYEETRNLLAQEFSDIAIVSNVIEQIADGQNRLNLIAGKAKEKESAILYTLEKLIKLGLVEKKRCMGEEKNKKKTRYILKDQMFRFWYRYIPKATSLIELGQGERYFRKVVKPTLHSFMGSVFEDICRHYALEQGAAERYGCFIASVGTWRGSEIIEEGGVKKVLPSDIDIVGTSPIGKQMIVGECEFTDEKIGKSVYDELKRRASIFLRRFRIAKYLFFSLSGYTGFFATLDDEDVIALTLEDLYRK